MGFLVSQLIGSLLGEATWVVTTNIAYSYYNSNNTTVGSNNTTTTSNSNNSLSSWNIYRVDQTVKALDIVSQWFTDATPASALKQDVTETPLLNFVGEENI